MDRRAYIETPSDSSRRPVALPPETFEQDALACGCHAEKIAAVHVYLHRQFHDYALRDFHSPTILVRAGLPRAHAEHHVVSLTHHGVPPYYAVLLDEFLAHSVEDIEEYLERWNLTDTLRANRIAVVSGDGVSAL
jgi:hypothetical protein